jgi:hypothetical protein
MFIEKGGMGKEVALPQVKTEGDDFYLGKGMDENQDSDPVRGWLAQSVPCHRPMEGLCRGSRGRSLAEWSV